MVLITGKVTGSNAFTFNPILLSENQYLWSIQCQACDKIYHTNSSHLVNGIIECPYCGRLTDIVTATCFNEYNHLRIKEDRKMHYNALKNKHALAAMNLQLNQDGSLLYTPPDPRSSKVLDSFMMKQLGRPFMKREMLRFHVALTKKVLDPSNHKNYLFPAETKSDQVRRVSQLWLALVFNAIPGVVGMFGLLAFLLILIATPIVLIFKLIDSSQWFYFWGVSIWSISLLSGSVTHMGISLIPSSRYKKLISSLLFFVLPLSGIVLSFFHPIFDWWYVIWVCICGGWIFLRPGAITAWMKNMNRNSEDNKINEPVEYVASFGCLSSIAVSLLILPSIIPRFYPQVDLFSKIISVGPITNAVIIIIAYLVDSEGKYFLSKEIVKL